TCVELHEPVLRLERPRVELDRLLEGRLGGLALSIPQVEIGLDQIALDRSLRDPDRGLHRRARSAPQLRRLRLELRRPLETGLRRRIARRGGRLSDAIAQVGPRRGARAAFLPE